MKSHDWPKAHLGEVLSHRKEFTRIDDTQEYSRCRVQLGARGVVLRDRIAGADIKTKEQQVCRAGELLVAEIDAKLGGFGVVPEELDGAIVSSHYFLYGIDTEKVNRRFLEHFLRTPAFQQQVSARGSTNYAAIRPHHVLDYTIPLPDRQQQDDIVGTLDAVEQRVNEAQRLRAEILTEMAATVTSLHHHLADERVVEMADLVVLDENRESLEPTQEYPQVGIRSFGLGLFAKPPILGIDTTYKYFNRLEAGMVVLSQVKGWEGAVAVCPEDLAGRYASPEYRTFRCIEGQALPKYMASLVTTPWFHQLLAAATRGQGARRQRTRPEMFLQIKLPMPSWTQQQRAVEVFDRLWQLPGIAEEMDSELTAVMPSVLDRAFRGEL